MPTPVMSDPTFTVSVKASGSRVDNLRIESVNESDKHPCSVTFITKAGKRWKMQLTEFSFVFPAAKKEAA